MFDRRTLVKGLAAMPLATVLADPALAQAAAESLTPVSITTARGRTVSGALAKPEKLPAPALVVIHEWWGLNDQIKAVTAELGRQGYVALAVDLMGGRVATTPQEAQALTASLNRGDALDTLVSWTQWLRRGSDVDGRVGTIGWCFGGGWSLNASLATPVDATVIYYGTLEKTPAELKHLQGPVLGHFGTLDPHITPAMVERFKVAMKAADRSFTGYEYHANHAFANPTGAAYDKGAAKLAWQRTLDFLKRTLKQA